MDEAHRLIELGARLRDRVDGLVFGPPVACTYNTLAHAWEPHRRYLERYGGGRKRAVFLGMNPGPFGMAQTGVPFGEVAAVRDWLGITGPVAKPPREHPKRPVTGFECTRSEVSGRRLWGMFSERWGTAEAFFREHFVLNYCPLIWMAESGANLTPDKLTAAEREAVDAPCREHLRGVLETLRPDFVVGVGGFAAKRAEAVTHTTDRWRIVTMLHPSPASPAANRGWPGAAIETLEQSGVWSPQG